MEITTFFFIFLQKIKSMNCQTGTRSPAPSKVVSRLFRNPFFRYGNCATENRIFAHGARYTIKPRSTLRKFILDRFYATETHFGAVEGLRSQFSNFRSAISVALHFKERLRVFFYEDIATEIALRKIRYPPMEYYMLWNPNLRYGNSSWTDSTLRKLILEP